MLPLASTYTVPRPLIFFVFTVTFGAELVFEFAKAGVPTRPYALTTSVPAPTMAIQRSPDVGFTNGDLSVIQRRIARYLLLAAQLGGFTRYTSAQRKGIADRTKPSQR